MQIPALFLEGSHFHNASLSVLVQSTIFYPLSFFISFFFNSVSPGLNQIVIEAFHLSTFFYVVSLKLFLSFPFAGIHPSIIYC